MDRILSGLQEKGLLTGPELDRARQLLAESGDLLKSLLEGGDLSEGQLLKHFSEELQCPYFETLDGHSTSKELLSKFSPRILLERHIAPIQPNGEAVYAVISDPFDLTGVEQLRLLRPES